MNQSDLQLFFLHILPRHMGSGSEEVTIVKCIVNTSLVFSSSTGTKLGVSNNPKWSKCTGINTHTQKTLK